VSDPPADPSGSADARAADQGVAPPEPPVEAAGPVEPGEPADGPARVRVRLTVAYDGAPFRGIAENEGVATVAGRLREALEPVLGHEVDLAIAGRTDAGVHAWGQVVSFEADAERADPARLARAVNARCVPTIVVRDAALAPPDFHARFSARSRAYRYTVLNRSVPDPFLAATSWWVPDPLDLNALRLGCDALIGRHDFTSFCRRPRGVADPVMVRRVIDARWHDLGDGILRFDIEASAFCQQMVRSITGTLVDMGRGRRRAGEMAGIIRGRDRQLAGTLAPPHGLCLYAVRY
jgi:tRNA pseudouridine38-40 synthase